jgi:hypothetical protein
LGIRTGNHIKESDSGIQNGNDEDQNTDATTRSSFKIFIAFVGKTDWVSKLVHLLEALASL